MPLSTRLVTAAVSGIVLAGMISAPATAAPQPGATPTGVSPWRAPAPDRTSAPEKKRVDRVKVKLDWYACYEYAQCATVKVPLDYDKPKGPKTEIAVLRVKARDQKRKIGSLFLNPGGPGGSGTDIAMAAPYFLGDEVLDRFDIVGFDPRGIANSTNVKCFTSVKDQTRAMTGLNVAFPWGKTEEKAFVSSSKKLGKACSTTGKKLAGAMSTAEVARDMDVLRRAVGDKKLNFLGFSYGSALGQYYANMFPDRVRAVVIDGVVNPKSWVGNTKKPNQLLDDRLRSADGAYKALREILVRCEKAGTEYCRIADSDPVKMYDTVAQRLRKKPLVVIDPEFGEWRVTYADFVGSSLGALYGPHGSADIDFMTKDLYDLTSEDVEPARRASASRAVAARVREASRQRPGWDFPYDNAYEAFLGVTCTDAMHPKDAAQWASLAAKADKRAPYFGRAWAWGDAPCARNSWTVRDEDAYRGPFNRRTSKPVLVVGNYWDPATNYSGAVGSAKLLPNSRLLSSDSWGHTAYGTSDCVTEAIDAYLVRGALPAKGAVCTGDVQPFTEKLPEEGEPGEVRTLRFGPQAERVDLTKAELAAKGLPAEGEPKLLPPVTAPVAGTPLR